jgi:hypothetical protein
MGVVPDVATVRAWATVSAQSLDDEQMQQIINAEQVLQAAVTRYAAPLDAPADYLPDALVQALLRRCSRTISARQLPLGLSADTTGEYAPVRLPSYDAEIERLESPYKIIAVA